MRWRVFSRLALAGIGLDSRVDSKLARADKLLGGGGGVDGMVVDGGVGDGEHDLDGGGRIGGLAHGQGNG